MERKSVHFVSLECSKGVMPQKCSYLAWFIRSTKISSAFFSIAILTYAMLILVLHILTLALHMLTLVC